jgi:hypothetical protein
MVVFQRDKKVGFSDFKNSFAHDFCGFQLFCFIGLHDKELW